MTEEETTIFRVRAWQYYQQNQGQMVLPRFVSPRIFRYLWLLLVIATSGVFATWGAQVPVLVSGVAIITVAEPTGSDEMTVTIFLPPETLPSLRVGNPLFLMLSTHERIQRPIVAVEDVVHSPAWVQEQIGQAGMAITQPVAVAFARLESLPNDLPSTVYNGSTLPVSVQTGSRRVISYLPGIGRFFTEVNSD